MGRANPIRFSSRFQDNESHLLCFTYRYYNPSVGRWLSRDPTGEAGGLNIYAFSLNNPVNYCDPTGLSSLDTLSAMKKWWDCLWERGGNGGLNAIQG